MARTTQAVEVNQFNAGLITDASPLTTPDNSSLEEDNMVLNIDGSRNRRLGMDYEDNYITVDTTIEDASTTDTAVTTFRWNNAGGDPERSVEVIQFGNEVKFFNLGEVSVSTSLFHTETFPESDQYIRFSYAVVDGMLVMVNGDKDIYTLELEGDVITRSSKRLLIRDFFGVEDIFGGQDITRTSNVQNRPTTITDAHLYNLRNQSFGIPRLAGNSETLRDPVVYFREQASNRYPSNSDTVTEALYNDANDADNRTVDRFFAANLVRNPLGTTRAPLGYFIIDALDRGTSRRAEYTANMQRYSQLTLNISNLPRDESPDGATVVAEFAGRVFYGGFTGNLIGSDAHSPKLSSYLMFSKVVENTADINLCYQEGDPTSMTSPDIVDTDGGFIRLNEAYGIQKLINLGSSLMVIASNGIWRVVGGDNGFTATQYIVEKITDRGCTSPESIAEIDNTFMFWSDDAIYHVAPDQFGSWACNNISFSRIQKLYDSINVDSKRKARGAYDNYERKVRWIYNSATNNEEATKELVLDIQLTAFYTNTIMKVDDNIYPKVVGIYIGLPYQISDNMSEVYVGLDQVFVGTEEVILSEVELSGISQREIGYLIITGEDGTLSYTFGKYNDNNFRDWLSFDGVGVDAEAYMVTSYLSGTDFQRKKELSYITVHLRRTETGYDESMNPINTSSCLVQSRWGWSNSDNSGKWGREFQAYRYRRAHLPLNSDDDYDNGFLTLITRHKVRGTGRVLSMRFRTEPYKNLHLYGWSMIFSVEDNV
jgi:hypothetical protein